MDTQNNEALKTIYDGVFENNPDTKITSDKYKMFIKFLDDKKKAEFTLSKVEIDKIITINENNYNFLICNVKELTDFNNKPIKYELSFYLENKLNQMKTKIVRTFYKKMYNFKYNDVSYICYTKESMKSKFCEINKKKEFNIIQRIGSEIIFISQRIFFSSDISDFIIQENYKYKNIPLENIQFSDIYNTPEIIKGNDLNIKLGLYTNLYEDDFNNFIYYETKERKKFFNYITTIFEQENFIGLCGPFGTGKTITLLKFLINSPFNRIFYINLWTIENISLDEIKYLLKYELIKLLGSNIFNPNNKYEDNVKNIYREIEEKINNFENNKNIFSLLGTMIPLIHKLFSIQDIYIIIDQYSSKYDERNKSLKELLNVNKHLQNINFIISSSMNNYDVRRYFANTLNLKLLLSKEKNSDRLGLDYFYIGCFIRLNTLKEYDEILKDKTSKFKKYLNELGNLPLFYYGLNKQLKGNGILEQYMEEVKEKIIYEINYFYNDNFKPSDIDKFLDILKILTIINKKEIYLVEELSEEILNLPMKFLEIKKEIISLDNLKIFASISNNQKIIDKIKVIEEEEEKKKDHKKFDTLIELLFKLYKTNFTKKKK